MKIILLSAGTGSRLMPLTRNTPKSLIDLGDGFTLLEKQIQAITPLCKQLRIVTGYRSEQIDAKVLAYAGSIEIETMFNPFYKTANNIVSAWLALKDETEDCVLINGDVVFRSQVLEKLLASKNDINMMITRKSDFDDDDMKVIIEGDRLRDVGKDIAPTVASGESIGMMYFRGRGLTQMKASLQRLLKDEANFQIFYLAALRQLMREGYLINYSECSTADWAEIDFHPDLQHMKLHLQNQISTAPLGTSFVH